MPSLRDYRDRIKSVKSTKKITSAMKMVAASKLRRAQEQAQAAQPYAMAMADMMARVAKNVTINENSSKLLTGTGDDNRHLLIVVTADRGLCGGFNTNIIKKARKTIQELKNEGKDVYVICAGRKGREALKRSLNNDLWKDFIGLTGKRRVEFVEVNKITQLVLNKFEDGEFDICSVVYNKFQSVLVQKPAVQQLIPLNLEEISNTSDDAADNTEQDNVLYEFEPCEEEILNALLPRNIGVQIFQALLDSAAGEQAARMTAMDNATRNAGEMIDDLSLQYNRARQAYITKELIEIISGAEAV